MNSPDAAGLAQMASEMASEPDSLDHTLHEILSQARSAVAAEGAAVMVKHHHRIEVAAASSDVIRGIEELQISGHEGPCRSATMGGPSHVIIADTRVDDRWPTWGPRVAELGWHSVLSLQLAASNELLGSLNLYARAADTFDEDDADAAELFARHASISLATALEVSNLRQAISARHVVGMAQGILMERYDIAAGTAFAVLRRHSQEHNVKLRQVAERVIERRRLPS